MGCQDDSEIGATKGGLSIYLTDGLASARALPSALSDELRQQFRIELVRDNDGKDISEYDGLLKDFGEERMLRVGTYQLSAFYGANKNLAWDEPYYYGEVTDLSIERNKSCSVTVNCKVANALADFTIVNPDNFNKLLKDYSVDVTVGTETIHWKPGDTANPYFKAGSRVNFVLKGISVVTNEECSYTLTPIESVKPGIKYNYKLKITPSNVGFDIVTEAQQEPVTINETVPESWLPKAKFSAEGFDDQNILTYTETADAVEKACVSYTALRPIQEVEFTLNFADVHYTSLNKTYKLSALSVEDKAKLEDAGIVLPTFDGISVGGIFDFHTMTPVMLTQNGGQSVDNQIKLKVFSNNRESEATYTIRTVKPIFKIGVYPGNIWTKEFTINPLTEENVETGNIRKFTNIQYEFSEDGNQWTAFGVDMHKEGLTPGTTYYVRAKYRGEVTGEIVPISTYPQIVLENGGLENADNLAGDDGGITRGTVFGWNGWATLNNMSTPSGIAAYSFNSRSGCRPTDDAHTGKAVRVITLGYGIGGFAKPKSAMHSELYLGTNADGSGNRTMGIDFTSRPTGLSFWYKCISNKGNDNSLAKIQIFSNDVLLGESSMTTGEKSVYEQCILNIAYDQDSDKQKLVPNKILILFKSGMKENLSIDNDLKSFIGKYDTVNKTADATFRGNELFVDDVELIYDK